MGCEQATSSIMIGSLIWLVHQRTLSLAPGILAIGIGACWSAVVGQDLCCMLCNQGPCSCDAFMWQTTADVHGRAGACTAERPTPIVPSSHSVPLSATYAIDVTTCHLWSTCSVFPGYVPPSPCSLMGLSGRSQLRHWMICSWETLKYGEQLMQDWSTGTQHSFAPE